MATLRKRIANAAAASSPPVNTGVTPTDIIGGAHEMEFSRGGAGHAAAGGNRRVAVCECGAQLAGDTQQALFEAAERHVAHHHPELVGALELDVVMQMAEEVGGIDAGRRPGA